MQPNLLILGGTREASALADRVARTGWRAILSYAGRVDSPRSQPIPTRVGGFGGPDGLAAFLAEQSITHLIDATHPFADQMSRNAISASAATGVPMMALTRAAWQPRPSDDWTRVADIDGAVDALSGAPLRVFLAIGRTEVERFARQPQHHYVLRFVDRPATAPNLRHHHVVVDRGPFSEAADEALLRRHRIELVVSKNSGGTGARAKIDAAGTLGLPVLMIDRPHLPPRHEVDSVDEVMAWIDPAGHSETLRGV